MPDLEAVRVATQANVAPVIASRACPQFREIRRDLDEEVRHWWPAGAAGELSSWSLVIPEGGTVKLEVVHFGAPLGSAGEALLASALRERIGVDTSVRDVALPTEPLDALVGQETLWIPKLAALLDRVVAADIGYVCVTAPDAAKKAKPSDSVEIARVLMHGQLERLRADRVSVSPGGAFGARVSPIACPSADRDAGAADAALDQ